MKRKNSIFKIILSPFFVLLPVAGLFFQTDAQQVTPDIYKGLNYRHIGPPGNRTSAVVGVPGDMNVYYVGAASGGIWKSEDAGLNWDPIFDDQPAQSIGALAIAPSNENIIWAGTGEPFIRSNISIGNGVYKSVDAGKSWQHMGLDLTGRIGRIVIDQHNPDVVLVGSLGHCYGPQKERGVYKTTDGGKTWKQVLFVDENTGCFEIAVDPSNSTIMFAGMWPLVIHTWGRESGGPGGGIYMSRDGGDTWKHLTGNGLPAPPIGKVGIAIAPSNPKVIYTIMETGTPNRGVLWRSNDGGFNWKLVSYDRLLNERSHYASRILVNPADENKIYFAANTHSISLDGGITSERSGWSGDAHDLWADPVIPDRMMISDDGGVKITTNRGKTWNRIVLPIAQMYHVAVDNQIPYYVYGGKQDGPGYKGPSTARYYANSNSAEWETTAGGECGFILPDPVNPNIVWGGLYNAGFTRVDYNTGHDRTVQIWPESAYGASAGILKYRFNWTFPIHISPHDNNKIYAGSQHIHVTTDAGHSWDVISPDLSTNDQSKMKPSGGLTKDNLGVEYGCIVFAIAESPLEEGCIWAGTNDGLVHITRDGGENWTNLTKNIPNLPPWGTISNIEPSRYNAATAYLTVDFHQMNNRDPFVYKTTNYGKTWKSISSTIPKSVFSYCHWIHEDPVRQGLLYLGTENAIYISFNDGVSWLPIQNNLPSAPVHHMVIQENFNDLVVGTYGRGFWIMDDITPLQQLTNEVVASGIHLFDPRPAYRLHSITGGPRVNSSASINYFLKQRSTDPVNITILDENGEVVNSLGGTGNPGINRVNWNLSYIPANQAKLRIKPPGNPTVVEEKRFRETWDREGWYPMLSWGTFGGFRGIKVAPGKYTITLTVAGQEFSQELTVLKDPRSEGTIEDIQELVKMQLELREDINRVTAMVNSMEWMRKQLNDIKHILKDNNMASTVIPAVIEFDGKIAAIENEILQSYSREGDSKSFRFPNLLYSKLSVLAGDVAENVDFSPNKQQQEVHQLLKDQITTYSDKFQELLMNELPEFNTMLQVNNISGIIAPEY